MSCQHIDRNGNDGKSNLRWS